MGWRQDEMTVYLPTPSPPSGGGDSEDEEEAERLSNVIVFCRCPDQKMSLVPGCLSDLLRDEHLSGPSSVFANALPLSELKKAWRRHGRLLGLPSMSLQLMVNTTSTEDQ